MSLLGLPLRLRDIAAVVVVVVALWLLLVAVFSMGPPIAG